MPRISIYSHINNQFPFQAGVECFLAPSALDDPYFILNATNSSWQMNSIKRRRILKRTRRCSIKAWHYIKKIPMDIYKIIHPDRIKPKKTAQTVRTQEGAKKRKRTGHSATKQTNSLILTKTSSNGTHVSTSMQAGIDLQSGILYSANEQDFKTSYSYCHEALEGFQLAGDKANTIRALKYMILSKIMVNEADHIPSLLASKVCSSVKGIDIDAVVEMAEAFRKRSLKSFQKCMEKYKKEIMGDAVVATNSVALQNNMLEKEILHDVYSELDLSQIENNQRIEKVISTMILDKKIYSCIDQHNGAVNIFTSPSVDKAYQKADELIQALNGAVEALAKDVVAYGKKLVMEKDTPGLEELMVEARPLYEVVGKAKAAKLIRELVGLSLSVDEQPKEKISLVERSIKWATDNNRVFLRRTLEARLIRLLNEQGKYRESMQIAGPLQAEQMVISTMILDKKIAKDVVAYGKKLAMEKDTPGREELMVEARI